MNKIVKKMTFTALIAAIYVACCFVNPTLASGNIQCRLSEGFCLLPLFFPESILGVTLGCLIFNCFNATLFDILFGTLATLLGCIATYFIGVLLKKSNDWVKIIVGGLPPVIFNAIIIPFVLIYGYNFLTIEDYWLEFGFIAAGEAIAVYVVGIAIYFPLKKLFLKLGLTNTNQTTVVVDDSVNEENTDSNSINNDNNDDEKSAK